MYNSGPLWVHVRRTMVVGVDDPQSGSLCCGCVRREEVLREGLRAITTTWGKTCVFDVSLANIPLPQASRAESRDGPGRRHPSELVFRSLPLLVLNYTCVVSAQTFHVSW